MLDRIPADSFAALEPAEFLTNAFNDWVIVGLYNIVLGRQPDEAGFNHWTDRLDSGAFTLTKMFFTFIESAEAQSLDDRVFDGDGNLLFPGARVDLPGNDPHFVVGFLAENTVNVAPLPGNRVSIGEDNRFDGAQVVVDFVDAFDFA